ncbi:MAG: hypothetical protein IJ424_01265 [Oscillospiraceae bacterium]|nr:hypothetical protein [Oscillospiraceae bacterium]
MSDKTIRLSSAHKEGFLTGNALLSSGIIIAPAVAAATDFMSALALSIVFCLVTYITVAICSFVPSKLVYTVRIILYTLVASMVYVLVRQLMLNLMPEEFLGLGIYAPLLITNSLITSKTETKFYRRKRSYMLVLAGFYVLGYASSIILFGTIRNILVSGTFLGYKILPVTFPSLTTLYGGFILLALVSALYRGLVSYAVRKGTRNDSLS